MSEMNWDDLRLFLAVARHGGLAGATSETTVSAPTLGRRMLALERRLGDDLFVRSARGYSLTVSGEALLHRLAPVEATLAPLGARDTGYRVKISAGTWTTFALCQRVQELSEPKVQLQFIAADERLDISHREAVIGIRNQRPDAPGLACRRMKEVTFAVYGDADHLPWARVMGQTPSAQWVQRASDGHEAIEVTHPRNALDLARSGVAKAVLPTFIGDASSLPRLTDTIADLSHDQWVVSHHEDRFEPPVRATLRRLYRVLS